MFTDSQLVYVIPAIFISLALHEAAHAYAAHSLGDDTAKIEGRLTLNPLKHIDLYTSIILPVITLLVIHFPVLIAKPVPFDPLKVKFREYGAAIVAIAGPITNLILAIIAAIILHIFVLPNVIIQFLLVLTEVNVLMFIFNMIPIPPIDGSRVLFAFAPDSLRKLMVTIESYGYMAIFAIFILVYYILLGPIDYCFNHIMNFLIYY